MNNWLFRFLTSGFGTGMAAPKALGWFIAIGLIGLWIFIWFVKLIYKLIVGEKIPKYKDGNYEVVLTSVGDDPKALKKQLKEFNGYSGSLANKVMKNLPSVVVTGLDKQSAEDFKIILDDTGATTEVRVITAKG
jgi:hypothetical protein